MQNQYQAEVLDWRINFTALPRSQKIRPDEIFFWKLLLVTIILLLVTLSFPWQAAPETGLQGDQVLQLINQDRIRLGLSPLKASVKLEEAAKAKAQDILAQGYFAHTSPAGLEPWNFIAQAGLDYLFAGENLALNYTNGYELVNDLLESPAHRKNLLSPLFSEIGVATVSGIYKGQPAIVTVQMFARPAN